MGQQIANEDRQHSETDLFQQTLASEYSDKYSDLANFLCKPTFGTVGVPAIGTNKDRRYSEADLAQFAEKTGVNLNDVKRLAAAVEKGMPDEGCTDDELMRSATKTVSAARPISSSRSPTKTVSAARPISSSRLSPANTLISTPIWPTFSVNPHSVQSESPPLAPTRIADTARPIWPSSLRKLASTSTMSKDSPPPSRKACPTRDAPMTSS